MSINLSSETRTRAEVSFPTVEEIRRAASEPSEEDAVFRRLHAPFDYLPPWERAVHREAVRDAVRCSRPWIFTEAEVIRTKKKLSAKKDGVEPSQQLASVPLREFLSDYLRLLAESCVLQRRIADALSRPDSCGWPTYMHSVDDAMSRPARERMLVEALEWFLEIYQHEQRRFAYGASLKTLLLEETSRFPSALHQLLLTSTRGDFWSRYDRDMLQVREDPRPCVRTRLAALYFNGNDPFLAQELDRIAQIPFDLVRIRRQDHADRDASLACARIKKGYAKLGDLSCHGSKLSADASKNILAMDQLLWIDNVFEKVIDHKMLLQHEPFLRLHLARLALACTQDEAPNPLALPHGDSTPELERLVDWFGPEARVFATTDTELVRRTYQIYASVNAESLATPERPAPRPSFMDVMACSDTDGSVSQAA